MYKDFLLVVVMTFLTITAGAYCADVAEKKAAEVTKPKAILVPPPPVTINLNMRMTQMELKLDAICSMVRYLYQRQVITDAADGKKTPLVPDIKVLGGHYSGQ